MKKRFFALVFALMMVMSLLPTTAHAVSGTWGDNITWAFNNGLLTISGSGEMDPVYDEWIDDGDYYITDAPWFTLGVTEVVVEDGVSSIGRGAFSHITTLESVTLADSVTVIGPWAFEDCTALETINLPANLASIRYDAFSGCESLRGPLVIPKQVTKIEDSVFAGCTSLDGVVLHDGITTIGFAAFENSGITSIEFPASVTTIDANAFAGSALTSVEIPATVTTIEFRAFTECPNLTAINVAEGNENYFSVDGVLYGDQLYAGQEITFLFQVPGGYSGVLTVPEGVERFEDYYFISGCTKITEIYLPASIGYIRSNLFYECTGLTAIHVDDAHETLYDIDGVLYGHVSGYDENDDPVEYLALLACPAAWSGATEYHVPEEVEELASGCFANCVNLENIYIGANTDSDCTAFQNCANLQGIWFEEGSKFFISDDEGVVFNTETTQEVYDPEADTVVEEVVPAMTILHFFPTGRTGYYEVPDGVTTIFDAAFTGAAIEAVKFPASLTWLGYWSMDLCDNLSWLLFTGDKPGHGDGCFEDVTATVYYPASNDTWNGEYGPDFFAAFGDLTYIPYADGEMPVWPGLETDPEPGEPKHPFTDVPAGAYYELPVIWALENGITTGATATTFNPSGTCLRAQVVTFLHRAAGNPEPASTRNPFTDVKSTDFFYKPVLWAVEKGITNGTSATAFGSYSNCNRAAVVTFLWRAAGSPEPESTENPFDDVKPADFFYKSVLWAIEKGITNGVDATHFGPTADCNRAQVVTFLYRTYAE